MRSLAGVIRLERSVGCEAAASGNGCRGPGEVLRGTKNGRDIQESN